MISRKDLEAIPSINRRLTRYNEILRNISYDIPDGLAGIRYDKDKVQSTPSNRQEAELVEWISKKRKFELRIHGYRKSLIHKVQAAYELIDTIQDHTEKEIVERHCVFGESYSTIAKHMGLSKSTVYRRYNSCLDFYGVK